MASPAGHSCYRPHEIIRKNAMTMRTHLLSGAAGLAIAVALSFGAQAQTAPPPTPNQSSPEMTGNMASGEPPTMIRHAVRHTKRHARASAQDSSAAEMAATERLNQQQLQGAKN
jgi:uncharacterized membrane protein